MDKTQPHPLFKLATELGPLIVFFVANAKFNLFVATGAFMVAIVAAMIASYVVTKHVPLMALVTGVRPSSRSSRPSSTGCSRPSSAADCCSAAPSSPSCSTRCST